MKTINWIVETYNSALLSGGCYPMTRAEAEECIDSWREDGMDVPENLTVELFKNVWNALCEEDGQEIPFDCLW